jgi:Flp pilus assembly protein TadG
MALNKSLIRDERGGTLILIALMLPLLLIVTGVTVDLGRLYAVKSRAQGALDASMLGAAATASSTSVGGETRRLFDANFTPNYMGSTITSFGVSTSRNTYTATAKIRVNSAIMQLFGASQTTLTIKSQVVNSALNRSLELALLLDNSSGVSVDKMRAPTRNFVTSLYAGANNPATTYTSVIPFNVAVNVGSTPLSRLTWPQNVVQFLLYGGGGNNGFLANHNADIPPNAASDLTDAPPAAGVSTRFRTPYGFAPGLYNNGDGVSATLARMLFASNNVTAINAVMTGMQPAGRTRINVGLMWAWYSLSARWTGVWDPAKPGLPLPVANTNIKTILLVSGSKNDVYLGGTQSCGAGTCPVSDDNATMLQLCTRIKAQGIRIYAIGFGLPVNYSEQRLLSCSSGAGFYYTAANERALVDVYQTIVDNMNYDSLRLTQ